MMMLAAAVGVASGVFIWLFLKPSNPRHGIYAVPGRWYWLKKAVFYLMFCVRKWQNKKKGQEQGQTDNFSKGYGKGNTDPASIDGPQILGQDPYAIDTAYYAGFGEDGSKVVFRIARRHGRSAELWLFLDLPGIGQLQHPVHPDTDVYNTDGKNFSAGGLTFELLQPMRRWKISYSGLMRVGLCNDIDTKPDKFVQTKISFIWDAFTDHFNFDTDISAVAIADGVARELWTKEFWARLQSKHQTHYEQWGEMRGRIAVEGFDERRLSLKTMRDHSYGVRDWRTFYRYVIHFIYVETGLTAQVGIVSHPDTMSHLMIGYVAYPNGDLVSVSEVSLKLWEVGEDGTPPKQYRFTFTANSQLYTVEVRTGVTPVWYHHGDRGGKVMEVFSTYTVNGREGRGLVEYFYRNPDGPSYTQQTSLRMLTEPSSGETVHDKGSLILAFTHPACACSNLVGGKGSQLALLSQVQAELNVTVPSGVCVTLEAFKTQLQLNDCLDVSITKIRGSILHYNHDNLSGACSDTVELFATTPICKSVRAAILDSLQSLFTESYETKRFAVRSSAAGEDGSEASSAGQMETFLGVMGVSEVLDAVRKCWASAYTFQAVEYRRQHGQPIRTAVGVVIQEMVQSEVSGVLFTADPVSGSTSSFTLNANFGLGESVVSGKADPDTFRVRRRWGDQLDITDRHLGRKNMMMVMTGSSGVEEKDTAADASVSSLSDDDVLRLCHIGVQLEKYFGSSRDVEWAMAENKVYLLQSRPITAADQETEEELLHEFDSPLAADYELLTTGNIGEMMPHAVTPLTWSLFFQAIDNSLQGFMQGCGARQRIASVNKSVYSCCNHLFIAMHHVDALILAAAGTKKEIAELSLLGMTLPQLRIEEVKDYVGRTTSGYGKIVNFFNLLKTSSDGNKYTKVWEKRLKTYSVGVGCGRAETLYADIHSKLKDYWEVWLYTLINSSRSGSWATILMSVLTQGKGEWLTEHYGDIAMLLSQCTDVYSADVPSGMQNLAKEIAVSGLAEEFLTLSDQDCVKMVKSARHPEIQKKFSAFLDRHGHRCIREAEMREKSWQSETEKLIKVIKTILQTKSYDSKPKPSQSVSQIIAKLKTPLTFFQKLILRGLLPKARSAVGEREWGKSTSVVMSEKFKQAYWRLASLMVSEGRIPDEDLLFFLTHQEIGTLISTRSARLIIKAVRRRRVHSKQMTLRFPKLNVGYPIPIDDRNREASSINTTDVLRGMPVSQGEVQGPARIITRLEDAGSIQAGDVLVVMCTDVGWSPYFPLIAGLVTEIGGLLSHGAVVAREYGIPCVVNVADATIRIKSGEMLALDGVRGTVKRLTTQ
ncbi:rifampicin phosphotransferase-like [Haliotis cracherodii]|uniref:rifampicin phosphotransferase-like n=1 Tax=Haliotis cracherodii TaxID=6455 RepID=UPI0039EB21C2